MSKNRKLNQIIFFDTRGYIEISMFKMSRADCTTSHLFSDILQSFLYGEEHARS